MRCGIWIKWLLKNSRKYERRRIWHRLSFYECLQIEFINLFVYFSGFLLVIEGVDIIDVGACSTRPGSEPVGEEEELKRLHAAFELLDAEFPDAVFSVDTFRARVARECVKEHSVAIINDVSGFDADAAMLDTVAELNVPYVLTHSKGAAGDTPHYVLYCKYRGDGF